MNKNNLFYKIVAIVGLILLIGILIGLFSNIVIAQSTEEYIPNPVEQVEQKRPVTNAQNHVNLFTGSASYSYDVEIPPGINGFQPSVSLMYNHHNAKDPDTNLAAGWSLPVYMIYLDTNSTKTNLNDDTYYLVMPGFNEKLILVNGEYHTAIESYARIETKTGAPNSNGKYWIITTKDGIQYRMGYESNSELVSSMYGYTTRWYLDTITDTHNNNIKYNYIKPIIGQNSTIYLNAIQYAGNTITFQYEPRVINPAILYKDDIVSPNKRLSSIIINYQSIPIRQYKISYQLMQSKELISSIIEVGNDSVSSLPGIRFNYFGSTLQGFREDTTSSVPTHLLSAAYQDDGIRFMDINADGFADILKMNSSSNLEIWLHNQEGWTTSYNQTLPFQKGFTDALGNDRGIRFTDLNDDGYLDIVQFLQGLVTETNVLYGNGTHFIQNTSHGIPAEVLTVMSRNESYTITSRACNSCFGSCTSPTCSIKNYDCDIASESCSWDCIYYSCRDDTSTDCSGNVCSASGCDSGCIAQKKIDDKSCTMNCWNVYTFVPYYPYKDGGYRFIDVNGDGKTDIVGGVAGNLKTWIKNSNQYTLDSSWTIPTDAAFVDSAYNSQGVFLIDVNGDGRADIVKSMNNIKKTWINTGFGWTSDSRWNLPMNIIADNDQKKIMFIDINNDGYVDIADGEGKLSYINTGSGWAGDAAWHIGDTITSGFDQLALKASDINGDGLIDFMLTPSTTPNRPRIFLNSMGNYFLLRNISLPTGGIITFDYAVTDTSHLVKQYDFKAIPYATLVVKNISIDNGMRLDQNTRETISYNYSGALFSMDDKQFRGFATVSESRNDGRLTIHQFHQTNGLKGIEYNTTIKQKQKEIMTIFKNYTIIKNSIIQIPRLTSIYQTEYDNPTITLNSGSLTTEIIYEYDNYGNNNKTIYRGFISENGDEYYEVTTYRYDTSKWILNKILKHTLFHFNNSPAQEIQYAYYTNGDINSTLELNNKGQNITKVYSYDAYGNIQKMWDGKKSLTTFEYDPSQRYIVKVKDPNNKEHITNYDIARGLILSETDPNGYSTNYQYDIFGRTIAVRYPYDTLNSPTNQYKYIVDGVAPEYIISSRKLNETNRIITRSSIDGFGKTLRIIEDANNKFRILDVYYDNFGRKKAEANPIFYSGEMTEIGILGQDNLLQQSSCQPVYCHMGSGSNCYGDCNHFTYCDDVRYLCNAASITELDSNDLVRLEYVFNVDPYLVSPETISTSNTLSWFMKISPRDDCYVAALNWNTGVYDTIAWSTDCWYQYRGGMVYIQNAVRPEHIKVLGDKVYVQLQWTSADDVAQLQDAQLSLNYRTKIQGNLSTSVSTNYEYDVMDRVTKIITPDKNQSMIEYDSYSYRKIDQNLKSTDYRLDAYQNIKTITEDSAGNQINTYYTYDSRNLLTEITRADLSKIKYEYDSLGRTTSISDPNVGTESSEYDENNNLIKTIDTNGVISVMNYDALNRLTNKTINNSKIVQYNYDLPYGQIQSIITPQNNVSYSYDQRYRVIQKNTTIDSMTFVHSYVYDSSDRVMQETITQYSCPLCPVTKTISYSYTNEGLKSVGTIITDLKYDSFGAVVERNYANGKKTTLQYLNATHQLISIITPDIQTIILQYENNSNIKSIDKQERGKTVYFYDALNRLIEATTNGRYILKYKYDLKGNVQTINSTSLDGKFISNNISFTYYPGKDWIFAMTQWKDITCVPNIECSNWTICSNTSLQNRTCYDTNTCSNNITIETQSCVYQCIPQWNCEEWSSCNRGYYTRNCYDLQECNLPYPEMIKSCNTTVLNLFNETVQTITTNNTAIAYIRIPKNSVIEKALIVINVSTGKPDEPGCNTLYGR